MTEGITTSGCLKFDALAVNFHLRGNQAAPSPWKMPARLQPPTPCKLPTIELARRAKQTARLRASTAAAERLAINFLRKVPLLFCSYRAKIAGSKRAIKSMTLLATESNNVPRIIGNQSLLKHGRRLPRRRCPTSTKTRCKYKNENRKPLPDDHDNRCRLTRQKQEEPNEIIEDFARSRKQQKFSHSHRAHPLDNRWYSLRYLNEVIK